jgi:hypothetical protein
MAKNDGPFHVVAYYRNDEFETYSIYLNNRRYLIPPRNKPLKRAAAYKICALLNGDQRFWPELPATKAELMAVQP